MELTAFLGKLQNIKRSGDGKFMSLCPAHTDKELSLSIASDEDRILVHCFAGCSPEAIVQSLGLQLADLFLPKQIAKPQIVATYDYTDEQGNLLFQVVRLHPKSFRQRRKVGERWVYSMTGVRKVLYHLPEVIKSHTIYFVEGEKDADNLMKAGVVATTSPGGANAWRDTYAEPLYGKRVILIPDNDNAGHAYMGQVACSLRGRASVSCILLPCKDISDWLPNHNVEELPKMEQPVSALLWGVIDHLKAENKELERRLTRIEQILCRPQTQITKPPVRRIGVKID